MRFNAVIPELTISSLKRSLSFYCKLCGFKIMYDRKESRFAFLALDHSQIMIQEGRDAKDSIWYTGPLAHPYGRGIHLQIDVKDEKKLHGALLKKGYPVRTGLRDNWYRVGAAEYGHRGFLVLDPDGYLLLFFQGIGKRKGTSPKPAV